MVDEKLEAFSAVKEAKASVESEAARSDVEAQIAELRAEISRLTETISAIGSGAKAVVESEAELLAERVRDRVRREPVTTLLTVAGVSFLFGLIARR